MFFHFSGFTSVAMAPVSYLRRVAGDLPDLLIERLQVSVHLRVDPVIQLAIDLHILRVRHELLTPPGHGSRHCGEIAVIAHPHRRIDRAAPSDDVS